ncbi:MAG TPA: APC family permease [Puia sp.]|nr:APC family permease [Puia sp.]
MNSGNSPVPKIVRKISVLPLAAVMFFTVSGGPYGLEPLIGYAGSYAIPLLILTPLVWDIPMILVVLELNSMMPVEGGYYEWVKRGLGVRWAFMEGCWTWFYSFVDLAIYPVLFVEYAAFFFPQIAQYKTPVCLVMIWLIAFLNIRGIVLVGRTALLLMVAVLIPFIILYYEGFIHPGFSVSHQHTGMTSLSLALFTIMWNCIGWDNATTYADEVNRPVRSYLKAIILAFSAVYIFYISFTYLALHSGISASEFAEKGIPYLGTLIGGNKLGGILSVGGLASSVGIFCAVMLSVSRVPAVMGNDKLLPKIFTRLHKKYQTPHISIIACACIISVLILNPLADLFIMDICLYTAGIVLEFIALIQLRKKAADEFRPFRIPLKRNGLIFLFLLPVIVFSIALTGALFGSPDNRHAAIAAILAIIAAPIAWMFVRRKAEGERHKA